MKSQTALKFFNRYINHENDHYRDTIVAKLQQFNDDRLFPIRIMAGKDGKIGEIYFKLFQLITIYNLKTLNKKNKPGKSFVHTEFDLMVEIVRITDKHLESCFPHLSRESFIETFRPIMLMHDPSVLSNHENPPKPQKMI